LKNEDKGEIGERQRGVLISLYASISIKHVNLVLEASETITKKWTLSFLWLVNRFIHVHTKKWENCKRIMKLFTRLL